MKFNSKLFCSIAFLIVAGCTKNVERPVSQVEEKNNSNYVAQSIQVNNSTAHSDKSVRTVKYIDISLGKVIPIGKINELEKTLGKSVKKISKAGDCGGFFEDNNEETSELGNLGINLTKKQAVIAKVVDFPTNFKVHYLDLIIDKKFQVSQINKSKYEVSESQADTNQNKFGLDSNNPDRKFDIMYSIRERTGDELLNLYYLNNTIIGAEVVIQC